MLMSGAEQLDLPPFTWGRVFTLWGLDPWLFVATVWVVGLYLTGVWVLRRRGDRWPWGRTVAFVVVGMGLFVFATQSGLAAYDTTLLSDHMVQHMILSMPVPLALALGAPVTLALRTLPGTPRRWPCSTRGWPGCCPSRRWRSRCSCCRRGCSTSAAGTTPA